MHFQIGPRRNPTISDATQINEISSHGTHHATVDVRTDAVATEAADADVEAAGVINTPVDAETADVVAAVGEKKPKDER